MTEPARVAISRPHALRFLTRPGFVVVLLLLALVASNLLHAQLATRDGPMSGKPGELLYAAAFDGFTDEWQLYDGQQSASIVDGRLQLAVSSTQTATWSTARHQFEEFDISVVVSAVDGPIDNAFGIVFGMRGPTRVGCDLPALTLCAVEGALPIAGAVLRQVLDPVESTDYYAFLISSDGYFALRRIVDGDQNVISTWIPSSHIEQGLGTSNVIRVVVRRSVFEFFINGKHMMLCIPSAANATSTFVDGECIDGAMKPSFRAELPHQGSLGLMAEATQTGGGGVVVQFDNVIVHSPWSTGKEDAKA